MAHLEDRWLLYKAAGGSGRRKLSAVPLKAEGYTGSILRGSLSAGNTMLYIVPLQDELELTPLPASAPEFALMPKASCKQCKTEMPLQMLALHINDCLHSHPETEDEDLVFVEEVTSGLVSISAGSASSSEDHCPQKEEKSNARYAPTRTPWLLSLGTLTKGISDMNSQNTNSLLNVQPERRTL